MATSNQNAGSYSFGSCTVKKALREVWLDSEIQPTTPKVFDAIVYLIEHRDKVVSKGELIDRIWRSDDVTDNAVARIIMRARTAIGDDGKGAVYIRTFHRVGYRFVAPTLNLIELSSSEYRAGAATQVSTLSKVLRLGLLPIDNQTGNSGLDFIDSNIRSMITWGLVRRHHLQTEPLENILKLLERVPNDATRLEKSLLVARLGNFDRMIDVQIFKRGTVFYINYLLTRPGWANCAKTFAGGDINLLTHQLFDAVEKDIL